MRFHLIDRIDAWEPGRSVRARKLTSRADPFWIGSGERAHMPEPLVLEALCQAGTWLVLLTTERRRRAALLTIGMVTFHEAVRPGDVLAIDAEVESMRDDAAVISGRVVVEGRCVLEARQVMCALIDAAELEDLDDTARIERCLTRGQAA